MRGAISLTDERCPACGKLFDKGKVVFVDEQSGHEAGRSPGVGKRGNPYEAPGRLEKPKHKA